MMKKPVMKWKKPDWREVIIILVSFILFLVLFKNWDEVLNWLTESFK